MKIVVIGGSGLIGTKLVNRLRESGHEVLAASRTSGVNTLTGVGLSEALEGAAAVVDVTNSPSFEDAAVLNFFETSTRNLLRTEADAGVGHHVALSVVGADRVPDSGYMRAKVVQEALIRSAKVPYTIVRAAQFFEFLGAIAGSSTEGGKVRLPPVRMQPIAADDVAAALADVTVGTPVNGIVEVAGPESLPLDELVRRFLSATGDSRPVIADAHAQYYGAQVNDSSLTPGDNARIGSTSLERWLKPLQEKRVGRSIR